MYALGLQHRAGQRRLLQGLAYRPVAVRHEQPRDRQPAGAVLVEEAHRRPCLSDRLEGPLGGVSRGSVCRQPHQRQDRLARHAAPLGRRDGAQRGSLGHVWQICMAQRLCGLQLQRRDKLPEAMDKEPSDIHGQETAAAGEDRYTTRDGGVGV